MSQNIEEALVKTTEKRIEADVEEARKAAGLAKPQTLPSLENAIADMKRQLRAESKANLIKSWLGIYAKLIEQQVEIERLNKKLKTVPSGAETKAVVNATQGESNE